MCRPYPNNYFKPKSSRNGAILNGQGVHKAFTEPEPQGGIRMRLRRATRIFARGTRDTAAFRLGLGLEECQAGPKAGSGLHVGSARARLAEPKSRGFAASGPGRNITRAGDVLRQKVFDIAAAVVEARLDPGTDSRAQAPHAYAGALVEKSGRAAVLEEKIVAGWTQDRAGLAIVPLWAQQQRRASVRALRGKNDVKDARVIDWQAALSHSQGNCRWCGGTGGWSRQWRERRVDGNTGVGIEGVKGADSRLIIEEVRSWSWIENDTLEAAEFE
ncbi:hypothetical protein C8R45DRAFT_934077 [Mycena sanguinolenta]|nr:hypothetical protein C8R45DRAFT_934077 [Mycena sanguinolenta]